MITANIVQETHLDEFLDCGIHEKGSTTLQRIASKRKMAKPCLRVHLNETLHSGIALHAQYGRLCLSWTKLMPKRIKKPRHTGHL